MYTKIKELKDKWDGCTLCNLSNDRTNPNVLIGQGPLPCSLLIIIPEPLYPSEDLPQPWGIETEEYKMYTAITERIGIDKQRVFITSTVGCKTPLAVDPSHVNSCRSRIVDLVTLLDPDVVALLGPEAMFSWTGANLKGKEEGIVTEDSNRKVIWTTDFSRYLSLKKQNDPKTTLIAEKIFKDWQWIKSNM
jgi:uracil-DNA glycosylase family 4